MDTLEDCSYNLLKQIGDAGIPLVEWELTLLVRLGVPLSDDGTLVFLVPDNKIQAVQAIAAGLHMFPADDEELSRVYPCELTDVAVRYLTDDRTEQVGPLLHRLIFMPLSWSGIRPSELRAQDDPAAFKARTPRDVQYRLDHVPGFVQTVEIGAVCAAHLRIVMRLPKNNACRKLLLVDLARIIGYCLFDLSYEDQYYVHKANDEPLDDQEKADMATAVADIRGWTYHEDEAWIRDLLEKLVTGQILYYDLPQPGGEVSHGRLTV